METFELYWDYPEIQDENSSTLLMAQLVMILIIGSVGKPVLKVEQRILVHVCMMLNHFTLLTVGCLSMNILAT